MSTASGTTAAMTCSRCSLASCARLRSGMRLRGRCPWRLSRSDQDLDMHRYTEEYMRPLFVVLPCAECQVGTSIPLQTLQDITQHQTRSATGAEFANFVCPHCGRGSLHNFGALQPHEATSFPTLVRPPLYCAALECDDKHCQLRVLVHTLAQSGALDAGPKTAAHNWKVGALVCCGEHHAKEPATLVGHWVFAPQN